jgi:hypothetical protein
MPISQIVTNSIANGAVIAADLAAGAALSNLGSSQLADANMAPGSVIQVVSTVKSDTFSTTTTGWLNITGISATITPISSSSRILVVYYVSFGQSDTNNRGAGFRVVRDGTAIYTADTAGNRIRQGSYTSTSQESEGCGIATQTVLDTPASTSAVTYQVQMNWAYGSYTACINRSGRYLDTTEPSQGNWTSGITVMEIAG